MVDMSVGVCTRDFSHRTVMKVSNVGRPLISKDEFVGEIGGVIGIESSWQLITELAFAARDATISVETLN